MNQLYNMCGVSHVKNQILFFNGRDNHFDDQTLTKLQRKNIQTFILESGDSIYNQPNDNGPNSKLRALYNILKAKFMLIYGTMRF